MQNSQSNLYPSLNDVSVHNPVYEPAVAKDNNDDLIFFPNNNILDEFDPLCGRNNSNQSIHPTSIQFHSADQHFPSTSHFPNLFSPNSESVAPLESPSSLYPCLDIVRDLDFALPPQVENTRGISTELYSIKCGEPLNSELMYFIKDVQKTLITFKKSTSKSGILLNRPVKALPPKENRPALFTYFLPPVDVEIEWFDRVNEAFAVICDVNSMMTDDLLMMAIIHFYNEKYTDSSSFLLRIRGRMEYLDSSRTLSEHSYIVNCCRYGKPLQLVLESIDQVSKQLAPTNQQENIKLFSYDDLQLNKRPGFLSFEQFSQFVKIVREHRMLLHSSNLSSSSDCLFHMTNLIQSIRMLCDRLGRVYPPSLLDSLGHLDYVSKSNYEEECFTSIYETALARFDKQINKLLTAYCRLYNTPYSPYDVTSFKAHQHQGFNHSMLSANVNERFTVFLDSMHRFPDDWLTNYTNVHIKVRLMFGNRPLSRTYSPDSPCEWSQTSVMDSQIVHNQFPSVLKISQNMEFINQMDNAFVVSDLPRETILSVIVCGQTIDQVTGQSARQTIAWVNVPLYGMDCRLKQGCHWITLWEGVESKDIPHTQLTTSLTAPLLIMEFKQFDYDVNYSLCGLNENELVLEMGEFNSLDIHTQESLHRDVRLAWFLDDQNAMTKLLTSSGKSQATFVSLQSISNNLWKYRGFLVDNSTALISLLLAITRIWPQEIVQAHWTQIQLIDHLISLMKIWSWPNPALSLRLLYPDIPYREVRKQACLWLARSEPEYIQIYLPQIMQCLSFDWHLNESDLATTLLRMSLESLHFANALYWQLKQCNPSSKQSSRLEMLLFSLKNCSGRKIQTTWLEQETVVQMMSDAATLVKNAGNNKSAKNEALEKGLGKVYDFMESRGYQHNNTALRMPFDMALGSKKLDLKNCNYFSSFTVPLRVVFNNYDGHSPPIAVMFKSGDDLRKDQLVTNLFELMDRIWMENGLDLKMVHFRVLPTSVNKGLVELVRECTTLRKVQHRGGLIVGPFDKHGISQWLRNQSHDEQIYSQAVKNFLYSSAACCVATYLLGIGDRHNDNIMMTTTGHMFHIDFAKMLGDFQKIAGINRDRVAFVFTPPMAQVLNDFSVPNERSNGFQVFIETCCKAYNLLRNHFYQLFSVLHLAASADVPGVNFKSIQYFVDALRLNSSDMEAMAAFSDDLHKSLEAKSTQINFIMHNLAQAKFTSANDGSLFSFTPQINSINVDGKISRIEIGQVATQSNNKVYRIIVYRVKSNNSGYIYRSTSQFIELIRLLQQKFHLAKQLTELANPIIKSWRSNDADSIIAAEERRDPIQRFVNRLLEMAPEISESDAVYTFFHTTTTDSIDRRKEVDTLTNYLDPHYSFKTEIKMDLHVSPDERKIMILIYSARNVRSPNREGANSYVKLRLLPDDNGSSKKKTKVVSGTNNPSFVETFTYTFDPNDNYRGFCLSISLWNRGNLIERNTPLGYAYVELADLEPGISSTRSVHLKRPDSLNESEVANDM